MTDFTFERNISKLKQLAANNFEAFSYQKLTVGGTAVALTIPDGAKYADVSLESSNTSTVACRWLMTGGIPTATDGKPLTHLTEFDITGIQNLSKFKAIQTAGGTHTLHIQYYK
jgi:hypothetical protein